MCGYALDVRPCDVEMVAGLVIFEQPPPYTRLTPQFTSLSERAYVLK